MRFEAKKIAGSRWLRAALPSEHGFWVMLIGALASALLRAGAGARSLLVAALTALTVIAAAGAVRRPIRRSTLAQLAATLLLSLSAVPVELASGVPGASIASAAVARAVVFLTSALVVRAAFARGVRGGSRRNSFLHLLSVAIASIGALIFYVFDHAKESGTCAMAAVVCAA